MRDDQFHIVLPSNSSMRYFPDNTSSSYTTELPLTIHLHGEWEVALSEIQFPSTFFHIRRGENELKFIDVKKGEKVETITKKGFIPYGIYKDIDELIDSINAVFKETDSHFSFKCQRGGSIYFSIVCSEDKCKFTHYLNVSDNLLRILGCGVEIVKTAEGPFFTRLTVSNDSKNASYTALFLVLGKYDKHGKRDAPAGFWSYEPYSLARGIPDKLFVYCDICEPYITGDVQSPLLRIVPVEVHGSDYVYGKNQVKHFSALHYIPLRRVTLREIEIDIKDELGQRIPFESGTSSVTLHFRRFH